MLIRTASNGSNGKGSSKNLDIKLRQLRDKALSESMESPKIAEKKLHKRTLSSGLSKIFRRLGSKADTSLEVTRSSSQSDDPEVTMFPIASPVSSSETSNEIMTVPVTEKKDAIAPPTAPLDLSSIQGPLIDSETFKTISRSPNNHILSWSVNMVSLRDQNNQIHHYFKKLTPGPTGALIESWIEVSSELAAQMYHVSKGTPPDAIQTTLNDSSKTNNVNLFGLQHASLHLSLSDVFGFGAIGQGLVRLFQMHSAFLNARSPFIRTLILIWEVITISIVLFLVYRVVNVTVDAAEVTVDVSRDTWSTVRTVAVGVKAVGSWIWTWVAYKSQKHKLRKAWSIHDHEIDADDEDNFDHEYVTTSKKSYRSGEDSTWRRVKRWLKKQLE